MGPQQKSKSKMMFISKVYQDLANARMQALTSMLVLDSKKANYLIKLKATSNYTMMYTTNIPLDH